MSHLLPINSLFCVLFGAWGNPTIYRRTSLQLVGAMCISPHICSVICVQNGTTRFTTEEVLKFYLGDESVNKDNVAIEDDSVAEYDGITAVDVLTDTDNNVEDLSSEEGSEVSWTCNFSVLDCFCIWYY